MMKQNAHDNPVGTSAATAGLVADRACGHGSAGVSKLTRMPSKRRAKRILSYKAIIGHGHRYILELGCGMGDLTYALVDHAEKIVGTDLSDNIIEIASARRGLWRLTDEQIQKIEFRQMSAVDLKFPDGVFDWTVSTSMIEHLHPGDLDRHLHEVLRVLKTGGKYLAWCPNGLGHHEDREGHLSMLSYAEWIDKMKKAGFRHFRSTLTESPPLVDARYKTLLERLLVTSRVKIMWSHLGVRNVLLVATK